MTPEQIATGRKLGAEVARDLVTEIQNMGLPAVLAAGQPPPKDQHAHEGSARQSALGGRPVNLLERMLVESDEDRLPGSKGSTRT